jgi:perosamine synthetase
MTDKIPLAIPNIGQGEAKNLQRCVETNFVSSVGEFVNQLEDRIATLSGTGEGVAMGAGTLALHMALHSYGIGKGDLVILPSFTFIASANAVMHSGARPWLFDVTEESWTIDPAQVRHELKKNTFRENGVLKYNKTGERVAAIMPVYTLGTPADMNALNSIARDYGLPIIADAAAAIGVTYKNQAIGQAADLTCYSFNGNKTITCGGGGMVVGKEKSRLERIKHISTTARISKDYDHDEVGYNYRMTNLQAAVGCAQLDRLNNFLHIKTKIRKAYDAAFQDIQGISKFPYPDDRTSTCWFSGIVVDKTHPTPSEICERLNDYNIEARVFWKPVHLQKPYSKAPVADQSYTENIYKRIVTLPCSTSLVKPDLARVITAVREILGAT